MKAGVILVMHTEIFKEREKTKVIVDQIWKIC